jgi:hypothetical protein
LIVVAPATYGGCASAPKGATKGRPTTALASSSASSSEADAGGEPSTAPSERAFCPVLPCVEQRVTRRILAHDERFGRFVCKGGMEASIATGGQVVACKLAIAITVDGLLLGANTFIKLDPDGHVAEMDLLAPRDFTIAGGREVHCGKGDVSFEQQRMRACVLGAPLKQSPVRCRVGESVLFHPNGALAAATIDEPVATPEVGFAPGSRVGWSEDGQVTRGTLLAPVVVRGIEIAYEVALHPSGALATVDLHRDATIQGHRFPAFAKIDFRSDGTLAAAEYVEARGIMYHGEPWSDTRRMTFDARGAVVTSRLEHFQATERPPWPGPRGGRR